MNNANALCVKGAVRPRTMRKSTIQGAKAHHPRMMQGMRIGTIKVPSIKVPCYGCKRLTPVTPTVAKDSAPYVWCPRCTRNECEACGTSRKLVQDPDSNRKMCRECLDIIGGTLLVMDAAIKSR